MLSHDRDLREPLFDYLEETYGKIRVLEEKKTGKSRADLVMVLPDALCGIEIKSDTDTYERLAGQVRDYDRYYSYNIVVVGTRHAAHIEEHVPDWWGIITVEWEQDRWDFYCLRKPGPNPECRWEKELQILWRPELAAIQEHYGMPKYKEKSKAFVIGKLIAAAGADTPEGAAELSALVSEQLFERDYTRAAEELADYRRGEIDKQLDQVTDPKERMELILKQEEARISLKGRRRKRRRRKRTGYL
ncbi:MAG: sce7726 family protein [Lachnospiraceae bacterium]